MIPVFHHSLAIRSGILPVLVALWMPPATLMAQTPPGDSISAGVAMVASTTSMAVLDNQRRLGKGDRLSYRVVEERRVPVQLFVTDSGEVEVPLIGRVQALGKTCQELAYAIKTPLENEYFFNATVIIALDFAGQRSAGVVYLSGQVKGQGPLEMPDNEDLTLSKAILKSGGLADFANAKKVRILRKKPDGGTETIIVDLEEVTKKGRLEKDPVLQPDDTIMVPEKFVNF